jgi:hypothetical protein
MIDITLVEMALILLLGTAYAYGLSKTIQRFMLHLTIILTAPLLAVFLGLTPGLFLIMLVGLSEIFVILRHNKSFEVKLQH